MSIGFYLIVRCNHVYRGELCKETIMKCSNIPLSVSDAVKFARASGWSATQKGKGWHFNCEKHRFFSIKESRRKKDYNLE